MKKVICAVLVFAGVFLPGLSTVDACGDKALRIGRGIRFRRISQPAAVLIYIPSNETRAAQVQSLLKKVGHKPHAVKGLENFNNALNSGKYDLVLSDLGVAAGFAKQIENASSKPVLVAVVSEGTKAEVAAALKNYSNVVKDPHSAENYLDAIDKAVRSRAHLLAKRV